MTVSLEVFRHGVPIENLIPASNTTALLSPSTSSHTNNGSAAGHTMRSLACSHRRGMSFLHTHDLSPFVASMQNPP